MAHGVRFWPPNSPLGAEVHWVLLGAFATPLCKRPQLSHPKVALNVASRLGLLPRIFARLPREVLRAELDACFETGCQQVHLSVARGLALERSLHMVDEVARSLGVRYVLLKGAAIGRHLRTNLGLRGACDIDLLLLASDAARLHQELTKRGYSQLTPTHPHYHLPTLTDTQGNAIELHTKVPCFGLNPTQRTVGVQDLVDHLQVTPEAALSERALLPTREFLVAHAVVHGIVQHGYSPKNYPLMRMLADVSDLCNGSVDFKRIETWIAPSVSSLELKALFELSDACSHGRIETTWQRRDGVGRLLRHLVLGAFDEKYAEGLKLYNALHLFRTFGGRLFLREYGRATFALPIEDLPRIYGSRTEGREFWFKLTRPIDVARRICKMFPGASTVFARQVLGTFSTKNED
jgi:hypothetical protein